MFESLVHQARMQGGIHPLTRLGRASEASLREVATSTLTPDLDEDRGLLREALAETGISPEPERPPLKRRKGKEHTASTIRLEQLVEDRRAEVSLLDIVTKVAHWVPWWRPFGPLSGSNSKLRNPRAPYSLVTFTCGTNMGPDQMARHLRGQVSAHEISGPGN